LAKYLKRMKCYAFGKSPEEIAGIVASLCVKAEKHALATDFSRLDGTIGTVIRLVEISVLKRLFASVYHDKIEKEFKRLLNGQGVTKHGVFYDLMLSRLSGSPETSNANTIATLFVLFVSNLLMGYNPDDAWLNVYNGCIAGGDDGLAADVDPLAFTRACKMTGLTGKGDVIPRGSRGVNFLSRTYSPDVWFGDSSSICCLRRAVWKFHTTANLPKTFPLHRKLYQKSLSLLANDSRTPVLGELCAKAVQLIEAHDDVGKLKRGAHHDDLSWWYRQYGNENSYPQITVHNWGLSELKFELPNFDYTKFKEWLDASTYDSILNPPPVQCEDEPIAIKADVVVNGEVHQLNGVPPPVPESKPKRKRKNRRGKKKFPGGEKRSAEVKEEVSIEEEKISIKDDPSIVVEPAMVPQPKPAKSKGKARKPKSSEPRPPD
jgi:hypothetical protein